MRTFIRHFLAVFLIASFVPSLQAVTLSLSTNQAVYVPSDTLKLSGGIVPSNDDANVLSDVYVAVVLPDGSIFTLAPNLTWDATLTPILKAFPIANIQAPNFYSLSIPESLPKGTYTFYLVATPTNSNPLDSSLWLGSITTTINISTTPTCTPPQVLQNNLCVTPTPTCTSPQVLQNGICVTPTPTCTSPQVLQNGICVTPTPTCTSPQVLQNGVCVIPFSGITPEIVQITPSSTNSMTLAWLPVSMTVPANQVAYSIYVSTTDNFTPNASNLYSTVIGQTQTTLSGLNTATTYYAIVIASDQQGNTISGIKYVSATTFNAPLLFNSTIAVASSDALGLGLYTQNGNTLSFNRTAGSKAPAFNSLLVAHGSDGYQLLRVDNVATSGSTIDVTTRPASLSDALDQATVSNNMLLFDVASTSSTVSTAAAPSTMMQAMSAKLPNGNRQSQINWDNQLLTAQQTDYAYQDNQLTVTPQNIPGQYRIAFNAEEPTANAATEAVTFNAAVKFTPSLQTDLRWSVANGIESGVLMATGVLSFDASVVYDFQAAASYTPAPFVLSTKKYTSLYFIGEVPVYQEVTLTVSAKVTASASAKINASTEAKAAETVTVGATYNPGTGWTPVFNQSQSQSQSQSVTAQININGGVTAEVRLIPEIQVKFYKVISGTLAVEPYLEGNIKAEQISTDPLILAHFTPPWLQPTQFDVNLGVESNISVALTTLFGNITPLPKTTIAGGKTKLFSLPALKLSTSSNPIRVGEVTDIQLVAYNGVNDKFNSNSIDWRVIPDTPTASASIVPKDCLSLPGDQVGVICHANLTMQTPGRFHVFASGYGLLGEVARQYVTLPPCSIGNQGPAGGIIFYVSSTSPCHGLEAAPVDQVDPSSFIIDPSDNSTVVWGCGPSLVAIDYVKVGSTSAAIGTGAANTAAIIAACGRTESHYNVPPSMTAAAAASEYSLNGYTDWYLPSLDELNQLFINRGVVGGFVDGYYWSSSEYDSSNAWNQFFGNGLKNFCGKGYPRNVRAVRTF